MTQSELQNPEDIILRWTKRARESQFAQYEAAEVLNRWHLRLGIPVVVLTTVVGTSLFASLNASQESDLVVRIAAGAISMAAAALGAIQTFLKLSEKAEKHRSAAARYGAVRRKLETLLAFKLYTSEAIQQVREEIDNLSFESPEIPKQVFANVQRYLKEHESDQTDLVLPARS